MLGKGALLQSLVHRHWPIDFAAEVSHMVFFEHNERSAESGASTLQVLSDVKALNFE